MANHIPNRVLQWLPIAKAAGSVYDVDPLLILAVVDRESLGGEALTPRGPAGKGDGGHGHGLAQIDDRYHSTFVAAYGPDEKPLWADPGFALLHLSKHLHFLRNYFDGVVEDPIIPAIAAYNVKKERVRDKLRELSRPISRAMLVDALDPLTTGQNYLSEVLSKRRKYVLT